jgi:hypothetical protein
VSWVKPVDGRIRLSAPILDPVDGPSLGELKQEFKHLVAKRSLDNPERFYYPPADAQIRQDPEKNILTSNVYYMERQA